MTARSPGSEDMRVLAEGRADVLLAQPADPGVRSEVIETMARIDPAAYRIGAEAVWLADQHDRATDIRVPTLVLCGADDHVTPPALSVILTRLIPGARCEVIERASHLANLDRPDEFNTLVGAFIRGVEFAAVTSPRSAIADIRAAAQVCTPCAVTLHADSWPINAEQAMGVKSYSIDGVSGRPADTAVATELQRRGYPGHPWSTGNLAYSRQVRRRVCR